VWPDKVVNMKCGYIASCAAFESELKDWGLYLNENQFLLVFFIKHALFF